MKNRDIKIRCFWSIQKIANTCNPENKMMVWKLLFRRYVSTTKVVILDLITPSPMSLKGVRVSARALRPISHRSCQIHPDHYACQLHHWNDKQWDAHHLPGASRGAWYLQHHQDGTSDPAASRDPIWVKIWPTFHTIGWLPLYIL